MPSTAQDKTTAPRPQGAQQRAALRGQASFSWPYRVFNIVFVVLVAGLLLLAIFANPGTAMAYHWYWLLCAAALGTGFFLLLHMLVTKLPAFGGKGEIITIGILLLLFAVVQFFVGWQLRVTTSATWAYGWDFPLVYTYAEEYVINGVLPDYYFLNCENNTGLYVLFVAFFSIFHRMGLTDFTVPTLVLNILCIDAAILLLYRAARLLMGQQKALFLLVCAFLTSPFLLYVPIYYTDTLTLPFVMGGVYLWLRCRSGWRKGSKSNALRRFCGLSVLCAAGALLKPTVLIVFIAACIDLLLTLTGKGRWKLLLSGAAIVLAVYLGGGWLVRNNGFLPAYNYDNGVPLTLWVLMGLTGQGGYNDATFQQVLASGATKASRSTYVASQISATVGDMGVGGLLAHLGDKLAYTFGDATYYAPIKLDQRPVSISVLHKWFIQGESGFPLYAYGSFAVHAAMLVGMLAGSIKSVLRKNDAFTFARVAVFGLILFLLIWETRSRYLVNFLPVMLLVALEGMPRPQSKAPPRKKRKTGGKKPATAPVAKTKEQGEPSLAQSSEEGEAAEAKPQPQPQPNIVHTSLFEDTAPTPVQQPQPEAVPEPEPEEEPARHADDGMITPEILSAEPELVEVTHTQSFDIPTGDPFYELAHTASWKVTELRQPQPAPMQAQQKERRKPQPEAAAQEPAKPTEPAPAPRPEAPEPIPEQQPSTPPAPEPEPSRVNSNDLLQRAMATAFAPAPPAPQQPEPKPQDYTDTIPMVPEDKAPTTDFPSLFAELEQELAAARQEAPRKPVGSAQAAPPRPQTASHEADSPAPPAARPQNPARSPVPLPPAGQVPQDLQEVSPADSDAGADEPSPFSPSKALQGMPGAETPPTPGEPRPLKTLWDLEKDL